MTRQSAGPRVRPRLADQPSQGVSPYPHPNPSNNTVWGGYTEQVNAPYNTVGASWTLPTLSGVTTSAVAIWVGFDGLGGYTGGNTVEQCGFDCFNSAGTFLYYPWTEPYPAQTEYWSPTAYPCAGGDAVSASVTWDGAYFNFTLSDSTKGWTYTEQKGLVAAQIEEQQSGRSQPLTSPICRASAQIIVEDLEPPLANFGTITFTGITPTMTSPIKEVIVNTNTDISVSTISGGSFSITWLSGT